MPKRLRLETSSRYIKTKLFAEYRDIKNKSNGLNTFFGTWEPLGLEPHATDVSYIITDKDIGRLDLISFDFYGSPNLWWVIAELNGIIDPITDMIPGQSLLIPTEDRIFSLQLESV